MTIGTAATTAYIKANNIVTLKILSAQFLPNRFSKAAASPPGHPTRTTMWNSYYSRCPEIRRQLLYSSIDLRNYMEGIKSLLLLNSKNDKERE